MKLTRKKHYAGFKAKVALAVVRGDRTPAVNEVARIAAMCRSVERNVLLSQAFADAMARLERGRLVSVGRYALRSVERPQELFTLDPFWTVWPMPA